MISQQDLEFLKSRYSIDCVKEAGDFTTGDYELTTNPKMLEVLNKNLDDINSNSGDVAFLGVWLKKLRGENLKEMAPFVWDDNSVIEPKVFPIGEHSNFFYYGLLIPKNVDFEVKGQKIGKRQALAPCLITSNREFLEVNERVKQDYKIDFGDLPDYLPKRWSLNKIREFLEGRTKKVDGLKLLNKIKAQYEKYCFIRRQEWYKIYALWDLGTYVFMIFEAYPFIENRGIAGSGKTKCMTISSFMSFNGGQIMINPTESTLFRDTDQVRGTKYFDEAEKLWAFNPKTKQMEGDTRTELINSSYTKEGRVPRQEKIGLRFKTKWYSPYSPTQLSSINGLFGATESRAITRICTKSPNEDNRGELEPSEDRNEQVWEDIRDECYRFALENWSRMKQVYLTFPKDCGLKRRELQIWKPLLSIAKFIDDSVYQEILNFAVELSNRRLDDLIAESSFDYFCLEALKNVIEKNKAGRIYVNAIKQCFCDLKNDDVGRNDIYLNRNISNHLDRLGFKEVRDKDRNGAFFCVSADIFNEIVGPICPKLTILSSPSSPSSQDSIIIDDKKNKFGKKCDDNVTICDDKKNKFGKNVTMVTICDENDDTYKDDDKEKQGEIQYDRYG